MNLCFFDVALTVRDFIASADNYDRFAAMISAASSSDPNTNQLVLFYNLSCEIFTYAATSDAGVNLMNWAKTYFRQNLLPWIINNNGLVS